MGHGIFEIRAFDRDLIRGGHYGQRSCVPRKQAEHMAAPTNAASEDSPCQPGAVHTWPFATKFMSAGMSAIRVRADSMLYARFFARDPNHTFALSPSSEKLGDLHGVKRVTISNRLDVS